MKVILYFAMWIVELINYEFSFWVSLIIIILTTKPGNDGEGNDQFDRIWQSVVFLIFFHCGVWDNIIFPPLYEMFTTLLD